MHSVESFERYATQQQRRLEEIRRTTERERELLRIHALRQSSRAEVNAVDGPPPACVPTEVLRGAPAGTAQQVIDEIIRGAGGRPLADATRWSALNERAVQLNGLDQRLLAEEHELDREEVALQRALADVQRRRQQLQAQLAVLRGQEADLHARELDMENEEKLVNQRYEEVVSWGHAEADTGHTLDSGRLERQGRLLTAQRTLAERKRLHAESMEQLRDRVNALAAANKRISIDTEVGERHIVDMERALALDDARVTDMELSHIQAIESAMKRLRSTAEKGTVSRIL